MNSRLPAVDPDDRARAIRGAGRPSSTGLGAADLARAGADLGRVGVAVREVDHRLEHGDVVGDHESRQQRRLDVLDGRLRARAMSHRRAEALLRSRRASRHNRRLPPTPPASFASRARS
ncbi:MAG: hypothetical protein MUF03_08485 [Rubrivivax sp.]|nr:hypothetical protein [Rubrivivax sp.]